MKPRITVITLGVDDLGRAVDFYKNGLGLQTEGIIGEEFEFGAVCFFNLENGLKLAVWPRKSIAHDTGISVQALSSTEMTIGQNVNTKEEVDAGMAKALAAGAKIVKPAADTFWGGYAGYFQDPDGHLWELVYNPELLVDEG
jgi:predicted lactoylglutathione lyase